MNNKRIIVLSFIVVSIFAYLGITNWKSQDRPDESKFMTESLDPKGPVEPLFIQHPTQTASPRKMSASKNQLQARVFKPSKRIVGPTGLKPVSVAEHKVMQAAPVEEQPKVSAPAPIRNLGKYEPKWSQVNTDEFARLQMQKERQKLPGCANPNCDENQERSNSYAITGVVVETERLGKSSSSKPQPIINGDVGYGDAQKQPVIYLK